MQVSSTLLTKKHRHTIIKMKIVIFFRFDCFPDKYTNSEIDTCIANMLKGTFFPYGSIACRHHSVTSICYIEYCYIYK